MRMIRRIARLADVVLLAWIVCLGLPPLIAQGGVPPTCGSSGTTFKVALDSNDHTLAQPEPGKALVYFVHDAGMTGGTLGYPTVRVAIDGAWASANHGNSWFSIPVQPGDHHVCVNLQSSLFDGRMELMHFTAEPNKVYFFRTRLVMSRAVELLELQPIDGDEGEYLVGAFSRSHATRKK
ncbi:MAG TPA: hypothetical protein VHW46_16200 [Terracidiphilus sp.]|jgi:hypothetical protein|nr:hypothetical protein [Terracidiphilus sp.]